jgi:hypothetical protein
MSITAADYADWAHFAGLYVRNVSHADRYRAYQQSISPAGLVTRIVFDFLEDNPGGLDINAWRSHSVYEMGADARWRLDQTAAALDAVGAPRAAARVRTAEDRSLFGQLSRGFEGGGMPDMESLRQNIDLPTLLSQFRESVARALPDVARERGFPEAQRKPVPVDPQVESREQIEHLLARYVSDHQDELQADYARLGDPRQVPGFDPRRREEEMERMRMRQVDLENQHDQARELGEAIDKLERQLEKSPDTPATKINATRRKILDAVKKYADHVPADLRPEMAAWLERARRVIEQCPAVFRPRPIDDAELLARLDDLGPYEVDLGKSAVTVIWDNPRGLECDWTDFSLSVVFPAGKKKSLKNRLDKVDRLRRNWARHQEALRLEVLQSFDRQFDPERTWPRGSPRPSDAEIYEQAGGGGIRVGDEGGSGFQVFFNVDWDMEHGLELGIEDVPEPDPADDAKASAVRFTNSGPALSESDVAAFEARHKLSLPADYRAFLLRTNGGQPEPNHLKLDGQAGATAADVYQLYTLEELEEPLRAHRAAGYPKHYLPVGWAMTPSPMMVGGDVEVPLLLAVSGPKAGKVVMMLGAMQLGMPAITDEQRRQMAAMMAGMFDMSCVPVAPSFTRFLGQLRARPNQAEPEWLALITAGDADRLLAWHRGGGDWKEKFTRYGDQRILTVVDYLALEASPAMLQKLVSAGAVKPRALLAGWSRWSGRLDRFRVLLPMLDCNQRISAFLSPQVWADAALLEELRQSGVDLEGAVDDEGATPLHMAVRAGSADGVRWLLSHGVSAGKADKYARTALVWAENDRQLECLKLLLEAGETLDSLFAHMPTVLNKLWLIRGRWGPQYPPLAEYLRSRGIDAPEP